MEQDLAERLSRHVHAIAARPRHAAEKVELEAAARYIESRLRDYGHTPRPLPFDLPDGRVRNIEVVVPGRAAPEEQVVVGAHYDSVPGAPGANDNGSGVAALLEIARLLRGETPQRTLRLVWFVNEEPPYFQGEFMGSLVYAGQLKRKGDPVVAMLSLETLGYFSDEAGSQRFPTDFGDRYPDRGEFIGFVGNVASAPLLETALASFRRHSDFPAEGLAGPEDLAGVGWSDHWSFWRQGYPALMVTDTAPFRYPHYHTALDTPDKVDYPKLARITGGLTEVVRDLAGR